MDKGVTDQYGKAFLFTLLVVVFTIGSAIFLSVAWLTLIGYWAWTLFNWVVA